MRKKSENKHTTKQPMILLQRITFVFGFYCETTNRKQWLNRNYKVRLQKLLSSEAKLTKEIYFRIELMTLFTILNL